MLILHFIFFYYLSPASLRVFQKTVDVDVAHQLLPYNGHEVGERPAAFHPAFHKRNQQVGQHGCPDLSLDGILVVSQKVFQREVLLQQLEQELYLPTFLVN